MSVLSYLEKRASEAVLSDIEKAGITTSITTLSSRLDSYFTRADDGLKTKFRFGSSVRLTNLPRILDAHSDIDYMIVFEKGGFKPQTYLDRLKRFAEERYSSSDIKQSSPTVVLELNHIKFDLVPALFQWGTTYTIPSGANEWQYTDPSDFNASLDLKNGSELYKIKPTIRLAKIWNAANDYVFDSFQFEKWIKDLSFSSCINQKQYLYQVFKLLVANTGVQWRNDRINRAKEIIANTEKYELDEMPYTAEKEIKKLIRE